MKNLKTKGNIEQNTTLKLMVICTAFAKTNGTKENLSILSLKMVINIAKSGIKDTIKYWVFSF
jgi:hypothetical protein